MKPIKRMIGSVAILTALTTGVNAQSTATASTTAVLVTPISVAKTTDMHFGTVAASATAGTVVLDYANGRTATGGVTLPAGGATPTTGVFTVTGQGSSTFSISIPSTLTLTSGGGATMNVSSITCEQGTSGTLSSGTKAINIGATLNVGAAQLAGTYTNASGLLVTVNYN